MIFMFFLRQSCVHAQEFVTTKKKMGFDKRFRDFYESTFVHPGDALQCSVERYFARVVPNITVHHAYMDMNSVVVEAVRSLSKTGKHKKKNDNFSVENFFKQLDQDATVVYPKQPSAALMERACKKIIKTVDAFYHGVNPSSTFMIALDGPAQLAKFDTRRERNYERVKKDGKSFALLDSNADYISGLQISPGTFFMYHVEKALDAWMTQMSKQEPKKHFILDGATTAGEGELKIIRAIHAAQALNDVHVVLSPDSDMYMSILNCMHKPNIYVFKHQQFGCSVVSKANMLCNMAQSFGVSYLDFVARDITFIGLLYGSDFTTSQPFFSNPRDVMQRYYDTVVSSDRTFLIAVVGNSTLLNVQRFASMIPVPSKPIPFDDSDVANLENYLTSVLWVLDQYIHGKCRDYPFVTTKPIEWNPAVLHKLASQKPVISVTFTPAPHPYLPVLSSILVHKHPTIMMSLLPPKIVEAMKKDNHTHLLEKVVNSASVHEVGTTLHDIISKYGRDDMQAWEHYALDAIQPALYVAGKSTPLEEKPFTFSEPQEYTKPPVERPLFKFGRPKRRLDKAKEPAAKKAKHDTPRKDRRMKHMYEDELMPNASKNSEQAINNTPHIKLQDKKVEDNFEQAMQGVVKPIHIKYHGKKEEAKSNVAKHNELQSEEHTKQSQSQIVQSNTMRDETKFKPSHSCSEPQCTHAAAFTIQSKYLCSSHYKNSPRVVQSLCSPLVAPQQHGTNAIKEAKPQVPLKFNNQEDMDLIASVIFNNLVSVHKAPVLPSSSSAAPVPSSAPPAQKHHRHHHQSRNQEEMEFVASVIRKNQSNDNKGFDLGGLSNLLLRAGMSSTKGLKQKLLARPDMFDVQFGKRGTCIVCVKK